jgi:serine/threonine protein kinase
LTNFEIWQDLTPIGQGGMSNVYKARDEAGNLVAIKFLHRNLISNKAVLNRFIKEANILKDLNSKIGDSNISQSKTNYKSDFVSAKIANIIDFDFDHEQPFIVTEFIAGQTLEDLIEDGVYELDQAIEVFTSLATTVSILHTAGIYHRDIKPANIIISDGQAYLIDFSISFLENSTRATQIGDVIGTPQYLSPEAHLGENTSASGDWWGLAASLCFALTGKPPFGNGPAVLSNINSRNIDLEGLSLSERNVLAAALDPKIENRAGIWETLEALSSLVKIVKRVDRNAILRHIFIVIMVAICGFLIYYIFR